jgi:DNA-directed RNA polymerase specialized sigma24 family protein
MWVQLSLCVPDISEKYEGNLRTLAASLLNHKAAVEDVVHNVFISLLDMVDRFEIRDSLVGYLKTYVANRSRDYLWAKRTESRFCQRTGNGTAGPQRTGPMAHTDGVVTAILQLKLGQLPLLWVYRKKIVFA